jgi:hypothetical protein
VLYLIQVEKIPYSMIRDDENAATAAAAAADDDDDGDDDDDDDDDSNMYFTPVLNEKYNYRFMNNEKREENKFTQLHL